MAVCDIHAATIDNPFVKRLTEAGVIPPHCTKFTLELETNKVIQATATYFLTTDKLEAVAKAVEDYPEAVAHFDKHHMLRLKEPTK